MAAGSVVVVFCPLPSACFLQSSGAMSAALIMSAADTADPDAQQQRAAGERQARGGRGDGRGRAVGRGKDAAQSIPPCKIIGGGVKIIDTGACKVTKGKKKGVGFQWRSSLYSSLFRS